MATDTEQKPNKNLDLDHLEDRSYSGCDIVPTLTIGPHTFILGNITAISYSIHRDKTPVRLLGHSYPKGYVSAGRTIAGTLVFTVFDRHVLADVINKTLTESDLAVPMSSPLSDQLPPFDVGITYSNEYGGTSYMRIYGLEITDEGQTHSMNDMYTENVMQYVARDIDLMVGDKKTMPPPIQAFTNTNVQKNYIDAINLNLVKVLAEKLGSKQTELASANRELAEDIKVNGPDPLSDPQLIAHRDALKAFIGTISREIANIEAEQKKIITDVPAVSPKRDSPYALERSRLNSF